MRRLLSGILIVLGFGCYGQEHQAGAGFGIEANLLSGKILKHTVNFRAPVPDRTTGAEVNLIWQTWGKKPWQQRRHYPVIGVGFSYLNFGIDSIYGRGVGVYPTLQLPLLRAGKFEWTLKLGCGLGFVTRHYERVPSWDTINNAVSTHINNYTLFATHFRYRINEHWDVQVGGQFSHMSNASLRIPNLGINVYGIQAGVRYFPVSSRPSKIKYKLPPVRNPWGVQVRAGIAGNEMGVPDGPLYPVFLLSGHLMKQYLGMNRVFIGLDYSYHKGIEAFLKNNEIHPGSERRYSWKSSIYVGNEFLIGRVGIVVQAGYYIHNAYLRLDPYYQKIGGNIYLLQREKGPLKELYTSLLLKTHKTQAELAELGIGMGF